MRDEAYDAFLRVFLEERSVHTFITKAFVARRTGKSPEQITRLLGSPGNWTFDTYAVLCAAIGYKPTFGLEKINHLQLANECHPLIEQCHPPAAIEVSTGRNTPVDNRKSSYFDYSFNSPITVAENIISPSPLNTISLEKQARGAPRTFDSGKPFPSIRRDSKWKNFLRGDIDQVIGRVGI